MNHRSNVVKVGIFAVVMLLVAAGLVVVFGQFRFSSTNDYHATFATASRLKSGNDVRIAGVPVGSVSGVSLNPDNTVDVLFSVDSRYRLYTSTRAVIRYLNLTGDRYLELAFAAGDLHALAAGATIPLSNTQPAVDLDALLGGLRPVLKGLDGDKINAVTAAVIDLLQGQGGAVSQLLSTTAAFTHDLSGRDQLIGDVVTNLNAVLGTMDSKSRQFGASVDTLQHLRNAEVMLRETARVGRTGVVAFPNFAHWPNRLSILQGRMPVTRRLPYQWYDTPNIRVGTYKDFEVLAHKNRLRILDSIGLQDGREVRWLPNARAGTAVFRFENA